MCKQSTSVHIMYKTICGCSSLSVFGGNFVLAKVRLGLISCSLYTVERLMLLVPRAYRSISIVCGGSGIPLRLSACTTAETRPFLLLFVPGKSNFKTCIHYHLLRKILFFDSSSVYIQWKTFYTYSKGGDPVDQNFHVKNNYSCENFSWC